jgi:hypothetical protein
MYHPLTRTSDLGKSLELLRILVLWNVAADPSPATTYGCSATSEREPGQGFDDHRAPSPRHHRAIGVPFQVHALQMLEGATIRYS